MEGLGVAACRRGNRRHCKGCRETGDNGLNCVPLFFRKPLYLRDKLSVAQAGFVSHHAGKFNLRSKKPPRRYAKHCCDLFNHIQPDARLSAKQPLNRTVWNAKVNEALNAGFIGLERSILDQEFQDV